MPQVGPVNEDPVQFIGSSYWFFNQDDVRCETYCSRCKGFHDVTLTRKAAQELSTALAHWLGEG